MFVRSEAQDHVTDEYGGRFRRLYPWEGEASPLVAMSANDNPLHPFDLEP